MSTHYDNQFFLFFIIFTLLFFIKSPVLAAAPDITINNFPYYLTLYILQPYSFFILILRLIILLILILLNTEVSHFIPYKFYIFSVSFLVCFFMQTLYFLYYQYFLYNYSSHFPVLAAAPDNLLPISSSAFLLNFFIIIPFLYVFY